MREGMKRIFARVALVAFVSLSLFSCGGGGGSAGGGGTGVSATAPDPQVAVSGTRQDFMGTSFIAPPGLTQDYLGTDGVALKGAQAAGQGFCGIFILPPRPAEADAKTQAINTVKAFIAPNFNEVIDPWGGYSEPLDSGDISRGVASAGWDYLYFWGFLQDGAGLLTSRSKVRILLAQLGAQVVPMIGLEAKDNYCLDDDNDGKPVTWALFYHSLTFTAFTPSTRPSPAQQLLGMWKNNSGTTYNGQTYAANGHYEKLSATQTYSTVSPTEVLVTTSTWLGDGSYQINGDRLTIFPNNGKPPVTNLFRIIEKPNSVLPGGYLPELYLLQMSDILGVKEPFEFSIKKDFN